MRADRDKPKVRKPSRDSPRAPARPTPATATEPAADPPFDQHVF